MSSSVTTTVNPYAAPISGRSVEATSDTARTLSPLHPVGSIGLAAYFGGPLGGAIMMSLNYRKLGRRTEAFQCLLIGFIATSAIVAAALLLPLPTYLGTAVAIIIATGVQKLAQRSFASEWEAMERRDVKPVTRWVGAGVGIGVALALLAVVVAIMSSTGTI